MAGGQYSLAEVAKITGKSEKTISRWIKSGKLPAIRQGTGYIIDGDDIPLKLDASIDRQTYIQQRLISQEGRDDKKNAAYGRKVELSDLIDVAGLIANGQNDRGSSLDNINLMFQKHQAEVEKIIREQNELAEKYARATYKIGQLEERNRLLEDSNLKLEQKMTLLPPPEQWTFTQQELQDVRENLEKTESNYKEKLETSHQQQDAYKKQIQEMQAQLERERLEKDRLNEEKSALKTEFDGVKEELQTEKQKGFWQRLFGS